MSLHVLYHSWRCQVLRHVLLFAAESGNIRTLIIMPSVLQFVFWRLFWSWCACVARTECLERDDRIAHQFYIQHSVLGFKLDKSTIHSSTFFNIFKVAVRWPGICIAKRYTASHWNSSYISKPSPQVLAKTCRTSPELGC